MSSFISVRGDDATANYEADGWTVDARGDLHIIKNDGQKKSTVATHAHGHWTAVFRMQATPAPISVTYRTTGGV